MKKRLKKKRSLKKFFIIILFIVFLSLILLICYRLYIRYSIKANINDNIVVELGKIVSIKDILKNYDGRKVKISPSLETLTKVGNHKVLLTIDGEKFKINVKVEDTTPPSLEVKDLSIYIDENVPQAKDFVIFLDDLSETSLEDIKVEKTIGIHDVEIVAKDNFNNKTVKKAKLEIKEDKDAPIFSGLTNLSVFVGSKPDLEKGVIAVDERFGNVKFTIDDSKVNYNKVGSYQIYYNAKDNVGNEVTSIRKIIIRSKDITYMINNFPTYLQFPNYPNGCESIALYTLLKYYNISVSPDLIVNRLKKGSGPYWENGKLYGGNPEIEFVGDPRAKNGYGVYQKPIIEVANYYKSGMIDYTGHSLSQVLEIVKRNIPVQVWASIGLKDTKVSAIWTYKPTGKTVKWIRNLHSMVIVGFNSDYVYVSDPYTGSIEKYDMKQFEKIYNLFGRRAIYYEK